MFYYYFLTYLNKIANLKVAIAKIEQHWQKLKSATVTVNGATGSAAGAHRPGRRGAVGGSHYLLWRRTAFDVPEITSRVRVVERPDHRTEHPCDCVCRLATRATLKEADRQNLNHPYLPANGDILLFRQKAECPHLFPALAVDAYCPGSAAAL